MTIEGRGQGTFLDTKGDGSVTIVIATGDGGTTVHIVLNMPRE